MNKKKKMNGLIVVNKEKGYTSRDVVNIIGKVLGTKKVGHTGTLDPIAEGVLVCVVGKCTKLCDILTSDEKEYVATMKFGILTDTLDITGNVLKQDDKKVVLDEVVDAINHFKGEYLQEVPIFSSVKVNGRKLYDYARNNEEVELPKRKVSIKNIEILEFKDNVLKFKVLVSKGTYIRSLIRDIGKYLGTYGTMIELVRTMQGNFYLEDSYSLDDIKNNNYKFLDLADIFKEYPHIEVDDENLKKICNGQELENNYNSDFVVYTYKNKVVAIYQVSKKEKEKIKPLILV